MSLSQTDRVLVALKGASHGVTAVDFMLPNTVDGGPPITRVAARVDELRKQGHRIDAVGRRDKCVIYVLVPAVLSAPQPSPLSGSTDGAPSSPPSGCGADKTSGSGAVSTSASNATSYPVADGSSPPAGAGVDSVPDQLFDMGAQPSRVSPYDTEAA